MIREMQRSTPALLCLLVAAFLLAGCEAARKRREARTAAAATVEAQAAATSVPVEATSIPDATLATEPAAPLPSPAPTNCGTGSTGSYTYTTELDGVIRGYRLYVPSSYDGSTSVPLVLNFHGFGSSAVEQEPYSRVIQASEQHRFIAVTPDGTNHPQRWYIYGQIEPGYVDDVAFVDRIIDVVDAGYCIDPSRVYAMGISNGAP